MDSSTIIIGMGVSAVAGFLLAVIMYQVFIRPFQLHHLNKELRDRKDQFISLASHYLLNPITVIQSAVAALQEHDSTYTIEQRNHYYDAILRGQQRLWIITQQLMLVGEIDQGNLKLNIGVGNLYDLVGSAVSAVDPFARAKQLKITLTDHTHEIRESRFDERRLKQALIGVIDNAIKFSVDGGEIRVDVSHASDIFTVTVEDFGIGMPDDILSHITEEFFRGTSTYTFDYEGIGLGLHIAQAIARLHQGNIKFTSKPKQGTKVTFEFPSL